MRCPVCKRGNAAKRWEVEHRGTWTGEYACFRCGRMRMCGHLKKVNGAATREVVSWHPACPSCGIDPVVPLLGERDRFQCVHCGNRIEVVDRRIVYGRTWRTTRDAGEAMGVVMWNGPAEERTPCSG